MNLTSQSGTPISPSASTRHQLPVTRHSFIAANPPSNIPNPDQLAPQRCQCVGLTPLMPSIGSISDAGAVVFQTYNWTKVLPKFSEQFLLDCENKPEPTDRKRQKKKPYRLRWPDEIRDEVLARLLALNAERAAQEKLSGTAPGMKAAKKTKPKKTEEDFQLD